MSVLVLEVRLHDGRYHGEGDWPPSPARLFQALVAAAGLSGPLGTAEREALEWLEKQDPPTIGAPHYLRAQRGVLFYVPNNDSDRITGDPLQMGKIRTATKIFRPYLFDPEVPFLYAWRLGQALDEEEYARTICTMTDRLYQLGRGIDMAWACGEVVDDDAFEERLAMYPGRVYRPSARGSETTLLCPRPGSLKSLTQRYEAFAKRFTHMKEGRSVKVVFRRPPKPSFQPVAYDSPPVYGLYELRAPTAEGGFAPWPLERAYALVVRLRDGAVDRLAHAMPARTADINRGLVGRKPDGSNDCPPENRVRIIPLPSIGHVHADREIRRVLVEVPATCPLRADDVHWAFSGLELADDETGEIKAVLTRTDDERLLCRYGLAHGDGHRVWRTVTPAALPEAARRQKAKHGNKRASLLARTAGWATHALRHAKVRARAESIRVQREPFEHNGKRAEAFAPGTRFAKERLWHVEITFNAPIAGPLVIGDGRFLGLGVMAPKDHMRPKTAPRQRRALSRSGRHGAGP